MQVIFIITIIRTQVRMLGDRIGGEKRPAEITIIIMVNSKKNSLLNARKKKMRKFKEYNL